jgi:hypothetical protein
MTLIFFNKPAVASVRLNNGGFELLSDIRMSTRYGRTLGKFP